MTDELDTKTTTNTTANNSINIKQSNSTTTNNTNNNNNSADNGEHLIAQSAVKLLLENGLNDPIVIAAKEVVAPTPNHILLLAGAPADETATSSSRDEHHAKTSGAGQDVAAKVLAPDVGGRSSSQSSSRKGVSNGLAYHHNHQQQPQQQQQQQQQQNNTINGNMAAVVSAATPSNAHLVGAGSGNVSASSGAAKDDTGVIDYTLHATAVATTTTLTTNTTSAAVLASALVVKDNSKFTTNNNSNSSSSCNEIGRHPISSAASSTFGGRLQFFKDGKFILELARKDGDKGGWVSVPRKLFRTPAATSSTVTPTSLTPSAYPKNESSTSLSFSDDNSSIQSSPWQRDHCWKQSTPRYGISKEMSLFYCRPKSATLTRKGFRIANSKRRRPYDSTFVPSMADVFMQRTEQLEQNVDKDATLKADEEMPKLAACKVGDKTDDEQKTKASQQELSDDNNMDLKALEGNKRTPVKSGESDTKKTEGTNNGDGTTGPESLKENKDATLVEKMNTSENDNDAAADDGDGPKDGDIDENIENNNVANKAIKPAQLNGNVDVARLEPESETSGGGGEEKRLKSDNTRAKLSTIIQQLNDRMQLRLVHLSLKTPAAQPAIAGNNVVVNSAFTNATNHHQHNHHNHSHSHKVSPPTSSAAAATTRLVEYHQQHVSPRKRILRELEKVSLEDNAGSASVPTGAAGGKRSRAKGMASVGSISMQYQNAKSPTLSRIATTTGTAATATTASTVNGNHLTTAAGAKAKSNITAVTGPAAAAPTRRYSSYSIHSLLSGGSSTPSGSGITKKPAEVAIVSSNYQPHYMDLRTMLASPKSPDRCGGKSPSMHAAAPGSKKRSPPYPAASPMHDSRATRSPTLTPHSSAGHIEYAIQQQRSPCATPPEYKLRFGNAERSGVLSPTIGGVTGAAVAAQVYGAPNAAHHQHYLQQHQQGFYSPYMMSPKYVPAPSASAAATANISVTSTSPTALSSRSPRDHVSAFSSTASAAVSSLHIPNSTPSVSIGVGVQRDRSPSRSTTGSPRPPPSLAATTPTPRTVPKKTASIRRQFAAPNLSTTGGGTSSAERNHYRNEEGLVVSPQLERKASLHNNNSGAAHLLQQQRASPISATVATLPLHYYMYPPPPPPPGSSGAQQSSHAHAAAAAAAAAYIPQVAAPTYYHQYLSTLAALRHNPMWLHHYPLSPHHAAVSAATPTAASRLSPPPYAAFPTYNHHMLAPSTSAAAAASMLGGGSGAMTAAALNNAQSPKLTDSNDLGVATAKNHLHHPHHQQQQHLHPHSHHVQQHSHHLQQLHPTGGSVAMSSATKTLTGTSTNSAASALFPLSIKDEHSSDVPLNLSKH